LRYAVFPLGTEFLSIVLGLEELIPYVGVLGFDSGEDELSVLGCDTRIF